MSIARKALVGAIWSSAANYLSQAVGMLSVVLLGRLLFESEFGLFATANSLIQFVFILSALSFNLSIVQSQEERDRMYGTALVLNFGLAGISLIVTGLTIAGYSMIRPLSTTEIAVISALALVNVVNVFGQLFDAILQRNLEFRRVSIIAFSMNLANPLVAMLCAWQGLGVWSLVAGQLAGAAVFAGGSAATAGWRVRLEYSRDTARWFLSMGWRFLGSRALEVVYTEIDRLVIKGRSGYDQVGLYDRAVLTARYPARIVTPSIMTVALPVYSRMASDRARLSEAYELVNSLLIRVLLPAGLLFALVPDVMPALLGERWASAAPILRILALYAVMHPMVENLRILLYALGRPQDVAVMRVIQIAIYLPALFGLSTLWGVEGAAWAIIASILAAYLTLLVYAKRYLRFSIAHVLAIPALVVVIVVIVFPMLPLPVFDSAVVNVLVHGSVVCVLFVLLELAFEGRMLKQRISWLIRTIRNPDPDTGGV